MAGGFDHDLPEWNADQDEILICRQVREETHDVKSFLFSARTPKRFRFTPGQFLTFDCPIGGEIVHRCYTISSAPTRPHLLSITVKRVPDGAVSNWLHDSMKPGMEIAVSGPMGAFCAALHPAPKMLFLSGGSGVTPLMSMSRAAHDLSDPADIVFVHSARRPADIIFRDELALIERNLPNFRAVPVCETDSPAERWDGFRGRLSLAMLELIAPDFRDREIFCCGPTPYMAAVRAILDQAGFERAHYHEESFVFEDLGAAQPAAEASDPAARSFRVTLTRSNKSFDCPADSFVLDAARKAGLRLASSCTQGLCGTCKSKMSEGKVEMNHKGGIRQREIDQGMVLICCSKPLSDLVIER
jgi:ferredoxin-NADP reductase